jgi:hypothetical protein
MFEAVIRAAKMKLSPISATMVIHMSVSGQWVSVNESRYVYGGIGGSVG